MDEEAQASLVARRTPWPAGLRSIEEQRNKEEEREQETRQQPQEQDRQQEPQELQEQQQQGGQ